MMEDVTPNSPRRPAHRLFSNGEVCRKIGFLERRMEESHRRVSAMTWQSQKTRTSSCTGGYVSTIASLSSCFHPHHIPYSSYIRETMGERANAWIGSNSWPLSRDQWVERPRSSYRPLRIKALGMGSPVKNRKTLAGRMLRSIGPHGLIDDAFIGAVRQDCPGD